MKFVTGILWNVAGAQDGFLQSEPNQSIINFWLSDKTTFLNGRIYNQAVQLSTQLYPI